VKCVFTSPSGINKLRKVELMGKHLLTREERIKKAKEWRKYMNKRHHIEAKIQRLREESILEQMKIKSPYQ
jgi:hypothetical protein